MSNPITHKLGTQILPYFIVSKKLNGDRRYYLSQAYLYGTDIIPFLGTVGVTGPVYDALKSVQQGAGDSQKVFDVFSSPVAMTGGIVVVLWFLLRTYVRNNSLIEWVAFVRSFRQQIDKAVIRLPQILGQDNPMPDLVKLQSEIIVPAADRALMDGVFSADALDGVNDKARQMAQEYEAEHSGQWKLPNNPALRVS